MGFFQELKEDLNQAVSELMEEDIDNGKDIETEEVEETEAGDIDVEELEEILGIQQEEISDTDADAVEEPVIVSLHAPLEDEMADIGEAAAEEGLDAEEAAVEEAVIEEAPMQFFTPALEEASEAMAEEPAQESAINNDWEEQESMSEYGDFVTENSGEVLDETAIITRGMVITGDINSQGSLEMNGSINGNIQVLGKLNVTGTINGDSTAAEIFADTARINGNIVSDGVIKIGQSSVIIGNVVATSAVVAGAVKGDIDVKGPVVLDASAIVMGNIKSKSVQINNGAVIEGLCSQAYADVNPTAFFEDLKKSK